VPLLAAACMLAAASVFAPAARAQGVISQEAARTPAWQAPLDSMVFDVLRDGEKIGEHRVDFERSADTLKVSVATEMEVSFAFLTLFRYQHQRVERWRGGELESLAGMTNENGREYEVSFVRKDGFFSRIVNGSEEEFREPLTVDSLWSKDRLAGGKLFSTARGESYRVRSDPMGWETIQAKGGRVEAEHVKLSGGVERDLWYGPAGELLKLRYETAEGETFEYVRR
jgi:hypothetical protein